MCDETFKSQKYKPKLQTRALFKIEEIIIKLARMADLLDSPEAPRRRGISSIRPSGVARAWARETCPRSAPARSRVSSGWTTALLVAESSASALGSCRWMHVVSWSKFCVNVPVITYKLIQREGRRGKQKENSKVGWISCRPADTGFTQPRRGICILESLYRGERERQVSDSA